MIKIGITGGIGSGKSTVSEIFKLLDIPVYISDIESKKIIESSPIVKQKLSKLFGESLYNNGKLDKALLASYIFADREKLNAVNKIIHPEVFVDFNKWVKQHTSARMIIAESAILYESSMSEFVDISIVVYTNLKDRIKRVIRRDNMSENEVLERIDSQMSDDEKLKKADFVIYNNEDISLIQQCQAIINKIL